MILVVKLQHGGFVLTVFGIFGRNEIVLAVFDRCHVHIKTLHYVYHTCMYIQMQYLYCAQTAHSLSNCEWELVTTIKCIVMFLHYLIIHQHLYGKLQISVN